MTPSSGGAPLAVTANASASTPGSGTITSYRFDFGDGTIVGPQPDPTASHTYAAGLWTAEVLVTDSNGATDSATVRVTVAGPCNANQVGNPSFETGTQGWKGVGCTIQQVAGGLTGAYACRVQSPAKTYGFNIESSPDWIASATAGTAYRFSAWVRSDAALRSRRSDRANDASATAVSPTASDRGSRSWRVPGPCGSRRVRA